MKVGDLVKYIHHEHRETLGLGLVLGFDDDDDPLIHFCFDGTPSPGGDAFFSHDVEVINESR